VKDLRLPPLHGSPLAHPRSLWGAAGEAHHANSTAFEASMMRYSSDVSSAVLGLTFLPHSRFSRNIGWTQGN
jgi:hypothetical protein